MIRRRLLLKIGILLISLCHLIKVSCVQSDVQVLDEQPRLSSGVVNTYVPRCYEGDMNLSDHETLTLQNREYTLTGLIVAEGDSSIVVKNATLIITPADNNGLSIRLRERARLQIIASTVVFNRTVGDCQILLEREAHASINGSRMKGRGYVIAHDMACIYTSDSHVGDEPPSYRSPGLATFDTSTVMIENSTVDGIYVWEDSTASVDRSKVTTVRTAWTESDKTAINLTHCRIGTIETWGGSPVFHVHNSTIEYTSYFHSNSYAWLEDCSISAVRATGNATVWLVNCSTEQIATEGNGRVFIGLYFPVIGLVGIPYPWVLALKVASVGAIVIGLGAIVHGVYLKRRLKKQTDLDSY